ncbi:rhombosortase [Alteromonadaceae bacterium M269]|nr:rhombosortase [Alteromonadaceae bacterium M269]
MLNLPTQKEYIVGPIILALTASLLFITPDSTQDLIIYHRTSIEGGEYWRLLTGNYLHTNFNHLLLNLGGLLLLWSLHGDHYSAKSYLAAFIFFCVVTSALLYFLSPEMMSYVGLSGALHSLFVWGAIKDVKLGYKTGWGLLIGVAIKIGYEQFVGPSADLEKAIGASVAVDAHLYGAFAGLLWALLDSLFTRSTISNEKDE